MNKELTNITVAILATNGVEQSELKKPREALEAAGAQTILVSLGLGKIRAWNESDFDETFPVDVMITQAQAEDFDALFLPGGVLNPDKLRDDELAVGFVQDFFTAGKPVAAICHGPQILINAGVVGGRTLTSYSSIKQDLLNAGANWVDEEVVWDSNLVTSRKPADIPAFNKKMIELFSSNVHPRPVALNS